VGGGGGGDFLNGSAHDGTGHSERVSRPSLEEKLAPNHFGRVCTIRDPVPTALKAVDSYDWDFPAELANARPILDQIVALHYPAL
jgi:hypothetical protein